MTGLVHAGRTCGDPAALERLRRLGGNALLRDMVALFREQIPPRMAMARAGVACGDVAAVKVAAHAMRSSCGPLGAVAMRELCEQVEHAARALDLTPVPALLDALEEEERRVLAWLERATSELAGAA
ncbi:MAG TPA: Hpt domain-containing protein [Gemmatimonadaceae bacterium]|nr:Hpt domain-containing protein [Gemmatimonadaceae bacterium]